MATSREHNTLLLTINLLHGEGFKNVNPCTAIQVYVKVHIKGAQSTLKTNPDKRNGTNPIWNSEMKFNLDHRTLLEQGDDQRLELVLEVKSSSLVNLFGPKKLGKLRLPVKTLYERVAAEDIVNWTSIRCPILSGSGRYKGSVYFLYRFGIHNEKVDFDRAAIVATASAPPLPPVGLHGEG